MTKQITAARATQLMRNDSMAWEHFFHDFAQDRAASIRAACKKLGIRRAESDDDLTTSANDNLRRVFVARFESFRGPTKFWSFVAKVDTNYVRSWSRRKKAQYEADFQNPPDLDNRVATPEGDLVGEDYDHLLCCVEKLEEIDRLIVRQKFYLDRSFAQIAEDIERTPGFVRKRFQRAKKSLKACVLRRRRKDNG